MSPEVTLICYLAAFVAFAAAFVISRPAWNLVALGLALAVLVPLWAAIEAL